MRYSTSSSPSRYTGITGGEGGLKKVGGGDAGL